MIYGIGTDIVRIYKIQQSIERFKDAFLKKIFTEREIDYCYNRKHMYQHYAARFAAKEAFVKALGYGVRNGIKWIDVEIAADDLGAPLICLYGDTKRTIEDKGINNILVSLSHCSEYAIANVVLEGRGGKVLPY